MLAFPVEGATYRSEGLGEREDVGGDEQVGVLGPYWMPVDIFSGDCDFRHQICACKCDALCSGTAQRNAADHAVVLADLLGVEEATELLGLAVGGDSRRQSHPKPFCASALDAPPGTRPRALSAMAVVPLGGGAVEADLQCHAIAWQ